MRAQLDTVKDVVSRVIVGALFSLLAVNVLADFLHTGRFTGLLMLAGESLVVVLTIVRRPAQSIDRSAFAGALTMASVLGPVLLRATDMSTVVPDSLTSIFSVLGLALIVVGKISLGRSFGLVPANRGVVVRGPYTVVRHPIYTGYLVTHVAFVAQHPSPWNACVLLMADSALILRALREERVLSGDAEYRGYCRRVGWHLVPGIF
jgi:protein-S-isoprenylcysteine O-methyltransferase Ste14